jgi:peroxiredoxin
MLRIIAAFTTRCIMGATVASLVAVPNASTTAPAGTLNPALTQAPDFKLMGQDNKPVNLADYKGKTVVLEWVNPQCPFVQRHYKAGTMVKLADKYKGQGVVWLSINTTNTASVDYNKKWAEQNKLTYPVLDDHEGVVGKAYGAKTTPHMFVINPKGQIVYQGAIDDDPPGEKKDAVNYVDKALTELLAGKDVATPKTVPYGCTVKYKE